MNYAKIIILALLLFSLTLLNSLSLTFINDEELDLKLLRANQEKIYAKSGKTLFIINRKLVSTPVENQEGRVKFNSFNEIIEITAEADLNKLQKPEEPKVTFKESYGGRNFLYLELASLLNGFTAGFNYEFFISKSLALSAGINSGSTIDVFFLSESETKFNSVLMGIKLTPSIHKPFAPELGYSMEYIEWETTQSSLFSSEEEVIDKDEDYISSLVFGFRYQPEKTGIAFKSGGKLLMKDGKANPGLYLNIGIRL